MLSPRFALEGHSQGVSCQQLEGQGLELSLLTPAWCSSQHATQLPSRYSVLSILPLFIHSFSNCSTAAQFQALFQGLGLQSWAPADRSLPLWGFRCALVIFSLRPRHAVPASRFLPAGIPWV